MPPGEKHESKKDYSCSHRTHCDADCDEAFWGCNADGSWSYNYRPSKDHGARRSGARGEHARAMGDGGGGGAAAGGCARAPEALANSSTLPRSPSPPQRGRGA